MSAKTDYSRRDFEAYGTRYRIKRLKAMHALKVFERFRYSISKADVQFSIPSNLNIGDPSNKDQNVELFAAFVKVFGSIIIGLKPEDIDELRQELFSHIYFNNNSAKTRQCLLGAEDMAFQNNTPVGFVYELIARSFTVNFSNSFPILLEMFTVQLTSIMSNLGRLKT